MEFHERLARESKTRKLSRTRIVEALNESGDPRFAISKATVGRWFLGQGVPSMYHAILLAQLLGMTVESLANGATDEAETGTDPKTEPLTRDDRELLDSVIAWERILPWNDYFSYHAKVRGVPEADKAVGRRILREHESLGGGTKGVSKTASLVPQGQWLVLLA